MKKAAAVWAEPEEAHWAEPEEAHPTLERHGAIDNRSERSSTEWVRLRDSGRDLRCVSVMMQKNGISVDRMGEVRRRDRGLVAIGVFKLVEAVFFFLVGLGVIHFIHRDLADAAVRLAERLRMDLDGKVMTWVFNHIDDITAHRLKQIGVATFFYAGLRVAEGVGLVQEKIWAEYLTIGVTVSFLPWEIYEIFRKPDMMRLGLLVANLAVLVYLAWSLDRRNRRLGRAA